MRRSPFHLIVAISLFATALSANLPAQSDQAIWVTVAERKALPEPEKLRIDSAHATIRSVADAKALLEAAQRMQLGGSPFDPSAKDFYCLIHVVSWKEETTGQDIKKLTLGAQNWFVYHTGEWGRIDFTADRLYGSRNVWLMAIHLNATLEYTARYGVDFRRLTPTPLENLFALASLLRGQAVAELSVVPDFIFVRKLDVKHLPGEIAIHAEAANDEGAEVIGSLGDPRKFINEGLYRFDFGVANSITKLSQLKFNADNGTVTPEEASTGAAFGTVNLYPFPVDVRTRRFSPYPYVVLGVGISRQPMQRMLFGVGWGPKFAQFYAGAALVKGQELTGLAEGDSATPDALTRATKKGYSPQFSFGINLPVRAFIDLLGEKK